MTPERAVIVGASHAGAQLAANLRREGWSGEVVLIGDEGVGCKTVGELIRRYDLPETVECIDGGTAGFELLSLLKAAIRSS